MNRYQFEDLISAYIDNELHLSKRKEVESFLKEYPHYRYLVDQIKDNMEVLKSSPKISAKEDFNKRLLTRINSHDSSREINIKDKKTIFGFSFFNATLMMSLLFLLLFLSLEIRVSESSIQKFRANKISEGKHHQNQYDINKTLDEKNLTNLNITDSKNDTIKKQKIDYSKKIKFVND